MWHIYSSEKCPLFCRIPLLVEGVFRPLFAGVGSSTPFSFCLTSSDCHLWLSLLFFRYLLTCSIPVLFPITETWGLSPLMRFPHPPVFWETSSALCCFFRGWSTIFSLDDQWWTCHCLPFQWWPAPMVKSCHSPGNGLIGLTAWTSKRAKLVWFFFFPQFGCYLSSPHEEKWRQRCPRAEAGVHSETGCANRL